MTKIDYLILGNSAAAVTAVEQIRATDTASSIRMVSPEDHAAYGRPLISYLLEGKTDLDTIGFREASFYADHDVITSFGDGFAAVSLDADAHTVTLENGENIEYGKVLVATGSVPFTPPIPGLLDGSNVSPFLTLDHALQCAQSATAVTEAAHAAGKSSRIIVVGAGLIGLKAAEALMSYADEIVVLEMAPRILPAVLDTEGAAILADALIERGIMVKPGITADHFNLTDGVITSATLTDGTELDCDFVVAAVGVRPNGAILEAAGAEMGRGVVTDATMCTNLEDVYAAGDVTQTVDTLDGSLKPLALWPNAIRQGKIAGQQMAGTPDAETFEGNFAVNAVDFFELSLLTGGIINPPEDGGFEQEVIVEGDSYAKFVTKDGLLFGYILLNRPDNAGIYTCLIERRIPLAAMADDIFDQAPLNIDFKNPDICWGRLHIGYPAELDRRGWKERA